ncbi:CheY-like chemotaxis protein [Paenibacillus sp. 1182]|uniref:response regulator n=1 Tax=Paenibacillus sp. 1182 TaxID=2806565 RepID=UPI001AE234F3|nr:response regulator [Paenibacillus sp. 1182]MBP1308747.1 CheY-like chemotaxis protein [Paenibacillus sp. 1182]
MSKRVLIVDDAYYMRSLIKKTLKEAGYEVVDEAKNAQEGIAKYFDLKPDFVTMDINMPDMSGIEATRQIVSQDPQAQIIAVTGCNSEDIKAEMLQAGAKQYLKKPFQPAFLLSKIDHLLADMKDTEINLIADVEEEDFFEKMVFVLPEKTDQPQEEVLVIKNDLDNFEFPDDFNVNEREQFALTPDLTFDDVAIQEESSKIETNILRNEVVDETITSNTNYENDVHQTENNEVEATPTPTPPSSPSQPKEEINTYMQIRPPRGKVLSQLEHDQHETVEELVEPIIDNMTDDNSISSSNGKGFLAKIASLFKRK